MKLITILAVIAGLALFAYLLFHFGAEEIFAGVAVAGWGVLWVALYRFVTIFAHGMGWRALFPPDARPPLWIWFRARWAGEAINSLLPVGQVGGDVARAQMVARFTSSGSVAGATVVSDFTLGLLAQLVYTVIGVALLAGAAGGGQSKTFLTGLLLAALAIAGLYLVQHPNVLGRLAEKFARGRGDTWNAIAGGLAAVSRETAVIYADRGRVAACLVWRLLGWLLLTGETWLALHFLGYRASLPDSLSVALILESLSMAVRSAAFALPGALGVQEAGFVFIGQMVGVKPELALALALVKRLREIIVGVPGLGLWAASEGKNLSNKIM